MATPLEEPKAPELRRLGPFKLNFNFFAAVFFILFSAAVFAAMPYQIEEPLLIRGQTHAPMDPALFPGVTLGFLFVIGVWYLAASPRLEEPNRLRQMGREGFVRVLVTVALFAGYALTMEDLGFILSSLVLVGGLTVFYGTRNPWVVVLVSVGVPTGVYYLFTRFLLVFLPEFSLFDLGGF